MSIVGEALFDIREGLQRHRVWVALASEDIGDQHQRTTLGPIWLLINYLIFAGSFVVLFSPSGGSSTYPIYVASGLFVWLYISEVITVSVTLFAREQSLIQGTTLPLSVYVMRLTMQSLIRAAYALFGCIAIIVLEGGAFDIGWLWAALGLLLVIVVTPSVVIICGIVGALFPDMQFVVSNVMRLGIFLTPVIWLNNASGGWRGAFYYWNPFTYYLEIVRIPLLMDIFPLKAFIVSASLGACCWLAAIVLLGKYRRVIPFIV